MGRPKICNPCCGAGAGSSSSSSAGSSFSFSGSSATDADCCCQDDVYSTQYAFSVSGVGAGTCSEALCSAVNGDWTVVIAATTGICIWRTDYFASCVIIGDNLWRWSLSMDCIAGSPDFQRINLTLDHISIGTMVSYRGDFSLPHDCLSPFTLTKISTDARCLGFPATIVVTPV